MQRRQHPPIQVGDRFGRLAVTGERLDSRGQHSTRPCLCDCGTRIAVSERKLKSGGRASCGCLQREAAARSSAKYCKKHGASFTLEYRRWDSMKRRCRDPKTIGYAHYGGRGIKVCERWLNSFEAFLADMGPCPSPKHSVDRIDNEGPYSPENCKWSTATEQQRNKSNNRMHTREGETLTVAEWCERFGISQSTVSSRERGGWSLDRALETPVKDFLYEFRGEKRTLPEWANVTGVAYHALVDRLKAGWSIERTLSEPTRRARIVEFQGEALTVPEWAKRLGISECTLYLRLRMMPVEAALSL
jgi:hypothetical protein